MGNRTASCACGQLRVMCAGDPMMVSLCHCLECQKRTGSTYGIAAFFSREAVKTEGDCRTYPRCRDWDVRARPTHEAAGLFLRPSQSVRTRIRRDRFGSRATAGTGDVGEG